MSQGKFEELTSSSGNKIRIEHTSNEPVISCKSICETHPQIASEWDFANNHGLQPEKYTAGSNQKIWWKCGKGHSYLCSIDKRTGRGQACPYCSGKKILPGFNDLKTLNPKLASEWNYEKNGEARPDSISLNSHTHFWWKCSQCHYEWQATPNDRSRGRACPICARKSRSHSRSKTLLANRSENTIANHSELIKEWDYSKNEIDPQSILIGSSSKAWWKCSICGNEWFAVIKNRANGSGCPKCMKHMRTSFPEQAIFFYLTQRFSEVYNGYTEIFDNKMELDIYIPEIKTGIEYDGVAFHSGKKQIKAMCLKYQLCKEKDIRLVRISEFPNDSPCFDRCIVRSAHTEDALEIAIIELMGYLNLKDMRIDIRNDRTAIMQQYITSIKDKSIAKRFPEVAKKWDFEKNGGLMPDQINAFSTTKYWWKCPNGHSYQAAPVNETLNTKTCPICTNHRVLAGVNDVASKLPDIATEWDYEYNSPIKPTEVIYTTQKKYWWLCKRGHHYQASLSSRFYGKTSCPYCANSKVLTGFNDLKTINPALANEWNYEKNGDLYPEDILPGSNRKVWWSCANGHEWEATVNSRNGQIKAGCPYCRNRIVQSGQNDLATKNPELLQEWDYGKNTGLNPSNIMPCSNIKAWWKCGECGKEWQASIASRTSKQKSGCPTCGYKKRMKETRIQHLQEKKRDLSSVMPEIAAEWDYEKNEYKPNEVSVGANLKVWWKCNNGHSYQSWLSDRTGKHKTGCPYCHKKRKLTMEP